MLADTEFDRETNRPYIRGELGAQSVLPAKNSKRKPGGSTRGVRAAMRRSFPQRLYRRSALVESLFSLLKRKVLDGAPGGTLPMQMRQALLLASRLFRASAGLDNPRMIDL